MKLTSPKRKISDSLWNLSHVTDLAIPGFGALIDIISSNYRNSSYEKNLELWCEQITDMLNDLLNNSNSLPESLYIIVKDAFDIASREHSKYKLDLLKCAIINSAKCIKKDLDLQSYFFT